MTKEGLTWTFTAGFACAMAVAKIGDYLGTTPEAELWQVVGLVIISVAFAYIAYIETRGDDDEQ